MAGLMSKRQQARNEKALHDLVQNVPGNNLCADCQTRNPAWASWSLGVFLCMRCASIHRKLGTHISKVKSLTMDAWTNEQVDNMKKVGNIASNQIYNPQNKKPAIPVDVDEADSVMERFIRQKYTTTGLNGSKKHNTGSSLSDEGIPPAVPPKTPGKFGFRSASSIFPLGSRAKKEGAVRNLTSPRDVDRAPSPRLANKPSRVFGATVESDGENTEAKLAKLRDMGFTDAQRNMVVLRGVNGNLERAIEALVRLGEGGRKSPGALTSPRESSLRATRSLTPITPSSALSPQHLPPQERPITPSTISSNNPFDLLPPQPQTAQSTGTLQNKNPYFSPANPFGLPPQPDMIAQAFQGMSLAPQQPLFPHHTGGIPAPQPNAQPLFPSSMTPPVPAPAVQSFVPMTFNNNLTYPQPAQAPANYNPFLTAQPVPVAPQPQTLSVNTATIPNTFGSNPFTRSPTRIASPTLGQIPEQAQPNFFAPQQASPQPMLQATNPFFAQQNAMTVPLPQPQLMPMPTGQPMYQVPRPDKASIMALYNYPQLAPQPTGAAPSQDYHAQTIQQQQPMSQTAQQMPPQAAGVQAVQAVHAQAQQPHRSVSSPLPGSKNPFLASPASPAAPAPVMAAGMGSDMATKGHFSRESVALGMDMAWNNGRHSPDAFASLSARHR